MHKVALISLGCPKNLVDSEVMLGNLGAEGFTVVSDAREADVVVVNTCGFLSSAVQEGIDTLLEATELKRSGKCRAVIAAGCMTQRYGGELADALPEVDGFIGVGQAHLLPDVVRRALTGARTEAVSRPSAGFESYGLRLQSTPSWTAYVKVSEGCDRRCSFCTIPGIRGPMVSRPVSAVVDEVEGLVANGVREVVLIGQDPTRYGVDLGSNRMADLLQELSGVAGLRWIRVMYLFPDRQADAVLEAIGSLPRVCRYVDMPLQHASGRVLRDMNRPGDSTAHRQLFERLRRGAPDATIRSTFLVGFPTETGQDFQELLEFVQEGHLDWLGGFVYSREQGTPAAAMKRQVPPRLAKSRYRALMEAQQEVTARRLTSRIGSTLEVLVEAHLGAGRYRGRFQGQAPDVDGSVHVSLPNLDCRPGDFVDVRITGISGYDLVGVATAMSDPAPASRHTRHELLVLS